MRERKVPVGGRLAGLLSPALAPGARAAFFPAARPPGGTHVTVNTDAWVVIVLAALAFVLWLLLRLRSRGGKR